ncbi:hypothetical protein KF707_00665 [Candidatus Obscuribacterales bacterium]|nr:hypothetical protein [Candidatus Obscuribacterales bacterium]MBX3134714.1 hypothetical protein [Candidatus Obscuribacterales bacterium]
MQGLRLFNPISGGTSDAITDGVAKRFVIYESASSAVSTAVLSSGVTAASRVVSLLIVDRVQACQA